MSARPRPRGSVTTGPPAPNPRDPNPLLVVGEAPEGPTGGGGVSQHLLQDSGVSPPCSPNLGGPLVLPDQHRLTPRNEPSGSGGFSLSSQHQSLLIAQDLA